MMRLLRYALPVLCLVAGLGHAQTTIKIGIGTQNTTTNTVTGGIVIKELKLFEKYLPKTGKYAGVKYEFDWQNATSGPPITNGMMADKIHIGMMGDYPLLVAGATGQATKNETQLVAIIAYNQFGAGNGVVVHKDSPYYELSDLKGKLVSVPFGSAAHGMMLQAVQARGWPESFWNLASQSPEVGTTNLQEKRIDGHGDFVPFAELLPFRGFARKIFDGAETKIPTFHGVVIRKDFGEKYPEIVVAYIKALMEANDWVRKNPKQAMEKIEDWTKIEKEVAYVFLGPSGIHTLDPTIKPKWVETIGVVHGVLQKMGRVKEFNVGAWVNENYAKQAFKELKLDYDKQKASYSGYEISGKDALCNAPIKQPREAGQIWIAGGDIVPFSSALCTLAGIRKYEAEGKKIGVAYVFDKSLGIKMFADKAFYAVNATDPKKPQIVPFLLKKDAEAHVAKGGGKLSTYAEALAAANIGK
ncbi:MAG: ABC transporter substrate-binding protein [Betaproteobacteria bacterium RIFCSPLOWO2_12_FULL_63_13]|nr:MAG: ABC transporter substrate-binding protein [Betaproteobacteria bacterium RIFCSPLOWO2_12_FULL_63_13]